MLEYYSEWFTILGTIVSTFLAVITLIITIQMKRSREQIDLLQEQVKYLSDLVVETKMSASERERKQNLLQKKAIEDLNKIMSKINPLAPYNHMDSKAHCLQKIEQINKILSDELDNYMLKIDNRINILLQQNITTLTMMREYVYGVFPENPDPNPSYLSRNLMMDINNSLAAYFSQIVINMGLIDNYIKERIKSDKKLGDVYSHLDFTVPGFVD